MKQSTKIKVLVVDDDPQFNRVVSRELAKSGFEVESLTSGGRLLEQLRSHPCDVVLLDMRMPGKDGLELLPEIRGEFPAVQVVMLTGYGTIDNAVKAVKEGAFDYLTKPSDLGRIETVIRRARQVTELEQQNIMLKQSLGKAEKLWDLVGGSAPLEELRRFIDRVARTGSSILLQGESGVGKEVVARAIHRASSRADQPFVVVDCAALHENLLASELFGHEKGAYTGAVGLKHGLFEIANGGTLFLDEIGEISAAIQAKLLRVLETGSFRRLGGNRDMSVDVRIIASTNRNLKDEMTEGRFREDLYYRLNVIVAHIPPLRDRREDVPLLAEHFLETLRDAGGRRKRLGIEALKLLCEYDWPGNVRELRNILERLVILSPNEEISVADLPQEIRERPHPDECTPSGTVRTLKELERDHIRRVLQITGGNRSETASMLGIDPKTLYRKLKE